MALQGMLCLDQRNISFQRELPATFLTSLLKPVSSSGFLISRLNLAVSATSPYLMTSQHSVHKPIGVSIYLSTVQIAARTSLAD